MAVSPTQKHDLMLVKDAFEKGALKQDTGGAILLPMVSSVQQNRRIHETIMAEAKNYPSATYQKIKAKDDQSFLKQKQSECIPCLDRIPSIGDLDMGADIFATLIKYDANALKNMLNLFKTVSRPNQIQQNLCGAYRALRSQCIPDIARIISQLGLLISHLRGFNLKSLKDQLIGLIGSLIVRSLVFGAINYDMYVQLITNVTRCIANDINTQLRKLEPILSRDGLEDIAELLPLDRTNPDYQLEPQNPWNPQSATIPQQEAAKRKAANWFPERGDFNYAKDISKKITGLESAFEKKLNTFTRKGRGSNTEEEGSNPGNVPFLPTEGPQEKEKGSLGTAISEASHIGTLISDMLRDSISVADTKLRNATSELLKLLKLSDGNMAGQIELLNQINLVRSVLEVLKTIVNTRGNLDPCGEGSGNRFFSKIQFPGQDIIVDSSDNGKGGTDIELTIVPPTFRIMNPIVEEILNENGIETGPIKSGSVVKSVPVSINISKCLEGKQ